MPVTTRSVNNPSQPAVYYGPVISGRVEKPKSSPMVARKSTPKKITIKKTTKTKAKGDPSAEDSEAETQLMRQISLGEIIFSNRFEPPWEEPKPTTLLGLPSHLRDKIINLVFPVLKQGQKEETGQGDLDDAAAEKFQGQFLECNYVHPVLWTCRQLRYEYGKLFLTNNHFIWDVPPNWNPSGITRFAQHAASVGAPDFPLLMDMHNRADGPAYKQYPRAPLDGPACRAHLGRWVKMVYYGVETRVLANDHPLERDDGLIAHCLRQAKQYREHGKSWVQLRDSLEEAWAAFLERRSLAEVSLGRGVATITALYKASNERLERARASSLGGGPAS
ncbi:hypothetical protein KVR01_007106 [Diaporthe batatas]|uniref:uncharacterized protein n=1 Tax=Diaporthe batatas TaxID=748121 RepID=UPI001D04CAD1|nr:uncharacterized protein KVR01_007106 [Diaporthe batatas]KAG8162628.1 hypothetical protein KVR01_007106 [Diaporthe batatas]